jgi:hypothetical protein
MKRRIIAFLMALTVICFNLFLSYQQANALLPVVWGAIEIGSLVIGTSAMAGVAAAWSTQGVTFSKPESSRNAIAYAIYHYPEAVQQEIANWPSQQLFKAKMAMSISQTAWDALMSTVDNLEVGENLRQKIDVSIAEDGTVAELATEGTASNPYICNGNVVAYIDGNYVYTSTYSSKGLSVSGSKIKTYVSGTAAVGPYTLSYVETCATTSLLLLSDGVTQLYLWFVKYAILDCTGAVCDDYVYSCYDVTYAGTTTASVVATDEAYYDYTKSGATVAVPQTTDGDRVISVPLSIPLTGAVDIAGTACIPSVNTLTDADTYTDATTGETATTEFRYPELQVPADTLKNKFPFSIPWDLYNAVSSLQATPEAPKWTIPFDAQYFVGGGEIVIDFSQFEVWAKILRYGELICFNIFLILATRKIIGAS